MTDIPAPSLVTVLFLIALWLLGWEWYGATSLTPSVIAAVLCLVILALLWGGWR
jgi:hypothetical protein